VFLPISQAHHSLNLCAKLGGPEERYHALLANNRLGRPQKHSSLLHGSVNYHCKSFTAVRITKSVYLNEQIDICDWTLRIGGSALFSPGGTFPNDIILNKNKWSVQNIVTIVKDA